MNDMSAANGRLDLVLTRDIAVPPRAVWRAWTEPQQLKRWFTPAPWQTVHAEIDARPGGRFRTVMRGPDGTEMDNAGVFLEVVPERRLVFTDTLLPGWRPAPKPFFTAIVEIAPHGTGTRYTATALHKDGADRDAHVAMGFHDGWGKALDQLVAVAQETAA